MRQTLRGLLLLLLLTAGTDALNNGVGRTPMMGWMAWVRFRCNVHCDTDPNNCISEKLFRKASFRTAYY